MWDRRISRERQREAGGTSLSLTLQHAQPTRPFPLQLNARSFPAAPPSPLIRRHCLNLRGLPQYTLHPGWHCLNPPGPVPRGRQLRTRVHTQNVRQKLRLKDYCPVAPRPLPPLSQQQNTPFYLGEGVSPTGLCQHTAGSRLWATPTPCHQLRVGGWVQGRTVAAGPSCPSVWMETGL